MTPERALSMGISILKRKKKIINPIFLKKKAEGYKMLTLAAYICFSGKKLEFITQFAFHIYTV